MSAQFPSMIRWTGNQGVGTAHYRAYQRTWDVAVPGKPVVHCSNDPALGGDPTLMNPEDMLISALAGCHMLWFLHFAANAGLCVTQYEDRPIGFGEEGDGGAGRFTRAVLNPLAHVARGADVHEAARLHSRIHEVCYIARSVAFPVEIKPRFRIVPPPVGSTQ